MVLYSYHKLIEEEFGGGKMVDGLESVQLHMIQLVTVMNNVKKGETEETKILRMMMDLNSGRMALAKLFLVPKLIKNVNFQ